MQDFDSNIPIFPRVWPAAAATPAYCKPQPLIELCSVFRSTTGWVMEHWPNSSTPFTLIDMDPDHEGVRLPRDAAERVCAAFSKAFAWQKSVLEPASQPSKKRETPISEQTGDLLPTDRTKAMIPEVAFVPRAVDQVDSSHQLNRTLEALLEFACKYAGGSQALLWILDDQTENLDLRADVGFGWTDKVNVLRRPLLEAAAEITALSGQAVVASNFDELVDIDCPFPIDLTFSAACLPVSSSREIFGVMWIDGKKRSDWDEGELELLEIVAGRIAAELECEKLRQQN